MRAALLVLIICLGGALGVAPAGADDARSLERGVSRQELSDRDLPPGPLATFARIEAAWAQADVDALVDLLDPDEKVRLSFTRGGPRGGYFNRDQAYFLLKDMFTFAQTDRFEFEKYWNLDSEGRSPYAVAVREFRLNDGAAHEDRVYLSLRRRNDTWWIGEIRTIDR
ncbi:MAG: hypothetical protein DHS20C21_18390 [Gemmatimonadota bacterium]|nr:MAG: hypothetical protein DHS20C21_18390 [Gemmatimonadota bacterium]